MTQRDKERRGSMRKISISEVREMANESREELFDDAESVGLDCPKLILHWTAGWGDQLFDDYHISITTDGEIYTSVDDLAETLSHTWKLNTGTVGVAMCCAVGATTDDLGEEPPTAKQIEVMAQVVAALCEGLWLTINEKNVLTHGEAADSLDLYDEDDLYGPNNGCERWDLQYLGTDESPRFTKDHSDPATGGNVIRGKAIWYVNEAERIGLYD